MVWSDEYANPDALRMGIRFVEDSVYGTLHYLYNLLIVVSLYCIIFIYFQVFKFSCFY